MAKPKIRFQGYTEDWEQRKVGDYLTESREIGNKGDVARKMTVKLWGKGVYEKLEAGSTNTQYFIRHANQFIYSKLDFLNCAFGVVPEELESLETTADVPAFDCVYMNPYFMFYRAIQPSFYIQNGIIANGSRKAKRIHTDTFLEMPISVPCLTEQNKIVGYFQSLDHLITLHQRKCDETKKMKKFMLQKMFPQDGKKVPEIRFKGFTEDWEQRKLGEVLKERTERAQGGEELLSVTIANGVIRQADSEKRNIASEDKSNYKIVRKGDIPYNSMRMWQGAVGNSEYDGIVSPAYTVLVPTDEANAKFFMEYFRKENSLQLFQRWSQGLTSDTWNLKYPTLSLMRFSMPSIEEQNRIAGYFEQLDHLITLHQRKCDKLQEIKKYMLQNMFI